MEVVFRTIERFPKYKFGSDGSVWSSGRCGVWQEMKPDASARYYRVTLNRRRLRVHALIAEAFHGPKPDGLECRHLNDKRHDNRPENLKYGTRRENHEDCVRNGRWKKILSETEVVEIVGLLSTMTDVQLGKKYEVNHATIRDIRRGKTWKKIPRICDPKVKAAVQ